MNMKKIFKEEESIEILKIIGLINNTEDYQKINYRGKQKTFITISLHKKNKKIKKKLYIRNKNKK